MPDSFAARRIEPRGTPPALSHYHEQERPEVLDLVPAAARTVLDVGCAGGTLGAALKAREGVRVFGLEGETDVAAAAAHRLDEVYRVACPCWWRAAGSTSPTASSTAPTCASTR